MPPHLCASSLKNYLVLILKHSLGLYIYLLNRLGSLYAVKVYDYVGHLCIFW